MIGDPLVRVQCDQCGQEFQPPSREETDEAEKAQPQELFDDES